MCDTHLDVWQRFSNGNWDIDQGMTDLLGLSRSPPFSFCAQHKMYRDKPSLSHKLDSELLLSVLPGIRAASSSDQQPPAQWL